MALGWLEQRHPPGPPSAFVGATAYLPTGTAMVKVPP
jgi:hypothetical protein